MPSRGGAVTCDICNKDKSGMIWTSSESDTLVICRSCAEKLQDARLPPRAKDNEEEGNVII